MDRSPISKQNLSDAVAEKLREMIRSNTSLETLKLPSESEIGELMGVSRITVRRALSDLEQEGLIQRIHGRGTFINPDVSKIKATLNPGQDLHQLIRESGYDSRSELVSIETVKADFVVADALSVAAGTPLYKVVCRYFANENPAIISIDYVPVGLFPEEPEREEWANYTTYELLRMKAGIVISHECIVLESRSVEQAKKMTPIAEGFGTESFLYMCGVAMSKENKAALYGYSFYNTKYVHFQMIRNIKAY